MNEPGGIGGAPRTLWYFVHIPKTAGTTVRHYLHTAFEADEVLFVYPGRPDMAGAHVRSFEAVASMPHAEIARYRVLYGHYIFHPDWRIHDRCRGLAFVRDPVARVVSWFRYVSGQQPERCSPRQRGYVEAIRDRGLDLEGLYEEVGGIAEIDNGIVRYLSGAGGTPLGSVGDAELAQAIDNVERWFDFVGHVGRFDESMREIARILGRPFEPLSARNASAGGRSEQLPGDYASPFVRRLTEVDAELVAWIEGRFFGG